MAIELDKWLATKKKEIIELQDKVKKIESLRTEFPDLDYSIDRWKHFRLHSAIINEIATDVDIGYSCGCCYDAAILARPYIIFNNEKIFAPSYFRVGFKSNNGDYARKGWKTEMKKLRVPKEIIEKIERFVGKEEKEPYEDPEPFI